MASSCEEINECLAMLETKVTHDLLVLGKYSKFRAFLNRKSMNCTQLCSPPFFFVFPKKMLLKIYNSRWNNSNEIRVRISFLEININNSFEAHIQSWYFIDAKSRGDDNWWRWEYIGKLRKIKQRGYDMMRIKQSDSIIIKNRRRTINTILRWWL